MIKLSLRQINKIVKKIKVFLEFSAENSFLFFLIMFLIVLLIGLFVFYHYVFLIETQETVIQEEKLLKLDTEKQARVLEEWQKRNETFYRADFKEHPDPFHKVD
jgi:hypothetical protein